MADMRCAQCGQMFAKRIGQVNRQRRVCGPDVRFFCTRECFGLSRRIDKSKDERVAEKAAYDRQYRAENRARLKQEKHEYFRRTYDPDAAREARKQLAEWQRTYSAEYRARPEWKEHKAEYDRLVRAAAFGEFAECHMLLVELEREIRRQPWYERAKERGYYDNLRTTNQRKRHEHIARW